MLTRLCFVFALGLAVGCGPNATVDGDGGVDATGGTCAEGARKCSGNTQLVCEGGRFVEGATCDKACDDNLGCVECVPGTGTCSGTDATVCRPDGSGYDPLYCDPLQGMSCNFETGVCDGECAPQNLGQNYIGCEYYPTITGNAVDQNFTFAVAISNTSSVPADVHIEGGALTAPLTFQAQPGTVEVRELPWVPKLKACNNAGGALECGAPTETSALVAGGAYHLRSSRPVTVYQFNPLDYVFAAQNSYSNDASLLLPVNAMSPNYIVPSYPAWPGPLGNWPGLVAITGTQDGTQVTIATTATATQGGGGLPGLAPGVPATISLNAGDVAQFFTITGDMTGTVVQADKPVQVIGGHYCTQVPNGTTACDHIEESVFPVEALSDTYIVTAPSNPEFPNGKAEIVRIVATTSNTQLVFDPPQAGVQTTLASQGDFVEIANTAASFQVSANHKILVVQYMTGQGSGQTGDPAMALAVPTDQYRVDYQFHAPQNYLTNYLNVVAPLTATVLLDGAAIPALQPVGNSGFGLARIQLANNGTGNYVISGDQAFGIQVYGYGDWTSFWYPGGLDLSPIVVE